MKIRNWITMMLLSGSALVTQQSCVNSEPKNESKPTAEEFAWKVDQFADLKILRYQVDGFEDLTPKQRMLVYYLCQAGLAGRDIIYDQNYKYNLTIREILENIYAHYEGDRETEQFNQFMTYLKRFWLSKGVHHHYSTEKFFPDFSPEYFAELMNNSPKAQFPVAEGKELSDLISFIVPVLYDEEVDAKRVVLDDTKDIVRESATNFYEGVSAEEVEQYYAEVKKQNPKSLNSWGLNSQVTKEDGKVVEKVWKSGGMYGAAIDQIVYWLEKAKPLAENEKQAKTIELLISYYKTGDLTVWDQYNIAWLQDKESKIDFINGFIEVYGDPRGMKGSYESIVNFKDEEATKRAVLISNNAQWFEDHSPVDDAFKKKEVKGVTAKVITAAILAGDSYPTTPIGVNLPNANWLRAEYGSKSVTIDNIVYAYDQSSTSSGSLVEFAYDESEIKLAKEYGSLASTLSTDLHECIGHASGQLLPGVAGESLKNYHSAVEETRAELFALYFMMDDKMVELGLMPNLEVAKAAYNNYINNGYLKQLTRVELGSDIEESHMRSRMLIAKWVLVHGADDKVVELKEKDGKHYIVINDYHKLRALFADLLKEIQRITSEGDFAAAKEIVEEYAVKVDTSLHKEIKERYAKLHLAPYSGFINPNYVPVMENGEMIDVKVEYPTDFVQQNMKYSEKFSFLPLMN